MLFRRRSRVQNRSLAIIAMATFCLISGLNSVAQGQADVATRPPTQELLPETTVLFVQIDDFRDMMGKIQDSAFGQLMAEEAIASLISGIWDEAKLAYEDVKENVGIELDDLTALPSGEMTFAIIAPRRKNPEYMLILELDEESEAVDRVLDQGRELIREKAGAEITTEESEDEIEFESFTVEGIRFKFFRKDGLMVGCSSESELDAFIDRWMQREVEKVRPLSVNRKFVTIMNRCTGTKDLKPEARIFIDPIALAKSATRGNLAAQTAINFLPVLGLDGLLGLGGSMILTEDDFESIVHGHVMLANPRSVIFEMIALKPTSYQPEPWLPIDTATYMTTSWDVDKMFVELSKMIEMFQGEEGGMDDWIDQNINEKVGINLKDDVLDKLTGRVTYAEWISEPIRLNSQVQLFAFELKDPAAIEDTVEKVVELINEKNGDVTLKESEHKGVRTWEISSKRIARRVERRRERRKQRGQNPSAADLEADMIPEPVFAMVGDYFLISYSAQGMEMIKHAIDTNQNDFEALELDPKYQMISQKMTRMLKTDMPCGITYQNPEHAFRFIHGLINSDQARSFLSSQAEKNKYVAGFKQRLDDNPLPQFDELKKYIRPAGGFATSDDTGYHVLLFNLRENPEDM